MFIGLSGCTILRWCQASSHWWCWWTCRLRELKLHCLASQWEPRHFEESISSKYLAFSELGSCSTDTDIHPELGVVAVWMGAVHSCDGQGSFSSVLTHVHIESFWSAKTGWCPLLFPWEIQTSHLPLKERIVQDKRILIQRLADKIFLRIKISETPFQKGYPNPRVPLGTASSQ